MLKKIKMTRSKEKKLVHLDLETLSKQVSSTKSSAPVQEDFFLGGVLRRSREAQKLTLTQVSQKLKIKEVYLSALENGQYYAFPGLTYGAGFLKSYARFLGEDERQLLARFYEETSGMKTPHTAVPVARHKDRLPTTKLIARMMILVLVFYISWYLISQGFIERLERSQMPLVDATQEMQQNTDNVEVRDDFFPHDEQPVVKEDAAVVVPVETTAE